MNGVGYETGAFGLAASFDGIDDKIAVADDGAFDFGTHSFSLSLWLKTTNRQTGLVLDKNQYNGGLLRIWSFYDSVNYGFDGDSASFHIQQGGTVYATTGVSDIYDGLWHHVAAVRIGENDTISIYIDGVLENSGSVTGIDVSSPTKPLVFGGYGYDLDDLNNAYSGLIDEVRIYGRAIGQSDVDALLGSASINNSLCDRPTGYKTHSELSALESDCDDGDPATNPGATEICNGVDDNCDDQIDEGVTNTYYLDTDNDGFGDINSSVQACVQPSGYSTNNSDCNDDNPGINPDAEESCNGVDDNCNNETDEGCKPYVETMPADSIKSTSAVIKGLLNPNGESTICYFEYGISSNYTDQTTTRNAGSETGNVNARETLYSLYPDTEYFYRLVATSIEGTTFGNELSFSTEPVAGDIIYTEQYGFCDGLDPCFSSIQDAIDSAENGMVIRIGCGIFYENVIIDKNITLEIGWDEYFSEIPPDDPIEIRGTLP